MEINNIQWSTVPTPQCHAPHERSCMVGCDLGGVPVKAPPSGHVDMQCFLQPHSINWLTASLNAASVQAYHRRIDKRAKMLIYKDIISGGDKHAHKMRLLYGHIYRELGGAQYGFHVQEMRCLQTATLCRRSRTASFTRSRARWVLPQC